MVLVLYILFAFLMLSGDISLIETDCNVLDVQDRLGDCYLTVKSACSILKCKLSHVYLLII